MPHWVRSCALFLLVPCAAAAQPSRDDGIRMLVAGDYQGAAQVLRPLAEDLGKPDPAAQVYGASEGCGNVLLYAFSDDRAELISVRADRRALRLPTTARSFDIALHPDALTVTVQLYEEPMRQTTMCDDVGMSPGPVTETWQAVAGRVTIELSAPGIRAKNPSLYRATIRIDNAEFIDSSGRRHRQAARSSCPPL